MATLVTHGFGATFVTMAVHLNLSSQMLNTPTDDQAKIHYMPCFIKHDGPTKVSTYFKQVAMDKDPSYKKASFRGRPLCGEEIALPAGYKGIVVQETKQPFVENVDRTLHTSHLFHKLTYWNWDKVPSANDPFISALSWIDISEAIHAPIQDM